MLGATSARCSMPPAAGCGGAPPSTLVTARASRVGLITGFYVPRGTPPAAETDGPVGAALLAKAVGAVGIAGGVATDRPCHSACAAALAGAGAVGVPVDVVAVGDPLAPLIET